MGCSGEKDTSNVSDSKESKDVMASLPEGPLSLPTESDPEANTHNDEGILHYKEGHFDIALNIFVKPAKFGQKLGRFILMRLWR
jgi:hypothetical protein